MLHIFVGMTQRKILCIHRNAALMRLRTPRFVVFSSFSLSSAEHIHRTYTFHVIYSHLLNTEITQCAIFFPAENRKLNFE